MIETIRPIVICLLILSFIVPANPTLWKLRLKGKVSLAESLEMLLRVLAIICQWTWYVFFGYVIWFIMTR